MNKLKLFSGMFLLVGLFAACAKEAPKQPLQWREEVQLADGRVVWVERTASAKGIGELGEPSGIQNEYYALRFTLPGNAPLPEWQGEYAPMIFDYDAGHNEWYIVSTFFNGCQPWFKLGKPKYPYIEYRVRNGVWKRVQVDERLVGHKVNMYGEIDFKNGEKNPVDLDRKNKQEVARWGKYYQRILSLEEQKIEFDWEKQCSGEADMNKPGSYQFIEDVR